MKKAITLLAACLLVFGFAGMASADPCVTCEDDPGNIARGCELGQKISCYPFDYEDFGECDGYMDKLSYCEVGAKGDIHRALFKICDCITDGTFENLTEGDTVDISMEILVDKGTGTAVVGNNGVYWAENVSSTGRLDQGLPMEPFASQEEACDYDETGCTPDFWFRGDFDYLLANGKPGQVYEGNSCDFGMPEDGDPEDYDKYRVVKFQASPNQTVHGYKVTNQDEIDNNSVWWIDIPNLRVDPDVVEKGWKVYVKICLYLEDITGGVCGDCEGCCCTIYIGELCCESIQYPGSCIYPYFPPANTGYWGTTGMVITNLADVAGTAKVTVYESDGDVGTADVALTANGIYLTTASGLAAALTKTAGSGTLGDSKFYATVSADVEIHGFVMIASPTTGEGMGYIPECCLSGCNISYPINAD